MFLLVLNNMRLIFPNELIPPGILRKILKYMHFDPVVVLFIWYSPAYDFA